MAYTSLVRPALEYTSSIWDPYLNKISYPLKRYKGGKLIGWNLITIGIVVLQQCSVIFNGLLSCRREVSRLKYFIMPSTITQLLKSHTILWLLCTYATCHQHPLHFLTPSVRTNFYKYSFFPKTIQDWNNLPTETIESSSLQLFLAKLTNWIIYLFFNLYIPNCCNTFQSWSTKTGVSHTFSVSITFMKISFYKIKYSHSFTYDIADMWWELYSRIKCNSQIWMLSNTS